MTPDGQSAELSANLPGGLELERKASPLTDRAGVEVVSRLVNAGTQALPKAVLRGHPQLCFGFGSPQLPLRLRQADGSWQSRPRASETQFSGDQSPAGAWGAMDAGTGRSVTIESDPARVRMCYVFVDRTSGLYNLGLFSKESDLAPGEAVELRQRLVAGGQ